MIDAILTNPAAPTIENPKKQKTSATDETGGFQCILAALILTTGNQVMADSLPSDMPQTELLTIYNKITKLPTALREPNSEEIDVISPTNVISLTNVSEQLSETIDVSVSNNQIIREPADPAINEIVDTSNIHLYRASEHQLVNEPVEGSLVLEENVSDNTAIAKAGTLINSYSTVQPNSPKTKVLIRDLQSMIDDSPDKPAKPGINMSPASGFHIRSLQTLSRETDGRNDYNPESSSNLGDTEEIKLAEVSDNGFKSLYSFLNVNPDKGAHSYDILPPNITVIDTEGSFVHDLLDTIDYSVKDKRSEIEIQLKPEHLGKLVLKVSMDDGVLAARFTVESSNTRDFLNSHLKDLRDALNNQGLNLSNLNVDIGSGQSFSHARNQHNFKQFSGFIKPEATSQRVDMAFKAVNYVSSNGGFNALV